MRAISLKNASKDLSKLVEWAEREPVLLQRDGHDVAAVVSIADYERVRALNVAEFERICDEIAAKAAARGMTPQVLDALLARD